MSNPRVAIKKVLISDACDSACAALLEKNGIEVQSKYKLPKDALIEELKVKSELSIYVVSNPQNNCEIYGYIDERCRYVCFV